MNWPAYQPLLSRITQMSIYAFNLRTVTPADIHSIISECYKYHYYQKKFAYAGRHIIRVIHGIPKAFRGVHIGEIELYLGRSYFDPDTPNNGVFQRFRNHYKNKNCEHGLIALSCDTEVVSLWERGAIKIIKRLRDARRLCVSNIAEFEAGQLPNIEISVIYITWKHKKPTQIEHPTKTQIQYISEEIAAELQNNLTKNQINNVLFEIKNTKNYTPIIWHPNHIN
ncbi:MAG TPA: hypothetical protein PKY50_03925 [Candidatus Competibacter sp.]|nr:hypothetical protein [Candidatus Competibacter sp.]